METLINAKTDRDAVRDALIRTLREHAAELPAEVVALLTADQRATDALRQAFTQYAQEQGS